MSTLRTTLCALLLGASLLACDPQGSEPPPPLDTPLSLPGALLYVPKDEIEDSKALLLDVETGRIARPELPPGKVHAYLRPGHPEQALLLTEGASARLGDGDARDAVSSRLMVFDPGGEQRRIELSARFGSLALSDDGRFAIAYGSRGSWSTADNIAIVDLEARATDDAIPNTTVRALDGQGPSAIAFAPASQPRRLAVLVMTDAVNVIDLERPALRDKVLPLKLPSNAAALRAKKVLFAGDHCFVLPDRGNDVIAVRFEDDGSERGFRAALSTLATESALQDIALLDDTANPRLLTLNEGSLRVIDTLSGAGESSPTMSTFSGAHQFKGRSPFDSESRPRALLYGINNNRLGFVDLHAELPGSERSVDTLTLSAGVEQITFSEDLPLAVVLQSNGKVSFVDLEERTVSLLDAGGRVTRVLLDERPGVQRAWMLTDFGSLGSVELGQRTPHEILLGQAATFVIPVNGKRPLLVVGQNAEGGDLVVIDASDPRRSSARAFEHFLDKGTLD